jgi:hypothetical protein
MNAAYHWLRKDHWDTVISQEQAWLAKNLLVPSSMVAGFETYTALYHINLALFFISLSLFSFRFFTFVNMGGGLSNSPPVYYSLSSTTHTPMSTLSTQVGSIRQCHRWTNLFSTCRNCSLQRDLEPLQRPYTLRWLHHCLLLLHYHRLFHRTLIRLPSTVINRQSLQWCLQEDDLNLNLRPSNLSTQSQTSMPRKGTIRTTGLVQHGATLPLYLTTWKKTMSWCTWHGFPSTSLILWTWTSSSLLTMS